MRKRTIAGGVAAAAGLVLVGSMIPGEAPEAAPAAEAVSSEAPSVEPSPEPEPEPTVEPTPEPAPEPTPTPEPEPAPQPEVVADDPADFSDYDMTRLLLDIVWAEEAPQAQADMCWGWDVMGPEFIVDAFSEGAGADAFDEDAVRDHFAEVC